jgi:hypothetical protein
MKAKTERETRAAMRAARREMDMTQNQRDALYYRRAKQASARVRRGRKAPSANCPSGKEGRGEAH